MHTNGDVEKLTQFYNQYFESDSQNNGKEFAENVLETLNEELIALQEVQLIIGHDYYIIEDAGVEFCAQLVGDGVSLATGNMIPIATTFFLTGYKLYKHRTHLEENEMDFCKYVIKHKYTFSDRVKYMPSGGCGFLLDDAISDYVQYKLEQGCNKSSGVLIKEARSAADTLIRHGVFKPREGNRYIVCF